MSGFQAWMLQRVTATIIGIFFILLLLTFLMTDVTWLVWKEWFSTNWIRLSVLLLSFSIFVHAWIGMRDVIADYIHSLGLRLFLLVTVALFLVFNGFWLLLIILGKL